MSFIEKLPGPLLVFFGAFFFSEGQFRVLNGKMKFYNRNNSNGSVVEISLRRSI